MNAPPSTQSLADRRHPSARAVAVKGWWAANGWLVARRCVQALAVGLFASGPLFGFWVMRGTLGASTFLDTVPFTDVTVAVQALVAGQALGATGLLGAGLLLVLYGAVNGRLFCSWICPVNPVTDVAHWLRDRLPLSGEGTRIGRNTRRWILGGVLVASMVSGSIAWELLNPVTALHRVLVFGSAAGAGAAWLLIAGVFLFDLVISPRGWCGTLCPVGAMQALVGKGAILRVSARRRSACDDCRACYLVCPEPQVIAPALKGADKGLGPVIADSACTMCGRCADVCPERVFVFTHRFDGREEPAATRDAQGE